MEYRTITDQDKAQLVAQRVQRLEAEHYDRTLTLKVLLSTDQTDAVKDQVVKLEAELSALENTIEKTLDAAGFDVDGDDEKGEPEDE